MASPVRSSQDLPGEPSRAEVKAAKRAGHRVTWDKFCKCIPLIATVNAIFNMHQKSVYIKGKSSLDPHPKLEDAYHKRIVNEPTWEQVALLVPVLGQIAVGISAIVEKCKNVEEDTEELVPASFDNFDDAVKYSKSYKCTPENMGTDFSDAIMMGERITELESKVDARSCVPEDLVILLQYATRDEGRSARAQFALGKYFASKDAEIPPMEGDMSAPGVKARFWLNQASLSGEDRAYEFLDTHPKYKLPI